MRSSKEPWKCVAPMTKPSEPRSTKNCSILSATSFGPPTQGSLRSPRPVAVMKSRTVGFGLPVTCTARSRMDCMPVRPSISSSLNGSSMPFLAKS